MCEAKHPEHAVQCELDSTGHMSHFAIGPSGTLTWRNEGVQPVPLPQPKARNGVTDEERKRARAVQDAVKAERDRQRATEGQREPTQIILGDRPANPIVRNEDPPSAHIAAALIEPERGTRTEQVITRLRRAWPEWVDGVDLATEECGGSEGLRRLRESGFAYETRPKVGHRTAHEYRLVIEQPTEASTGRVLRDFP